MSGQHAASRRHAPVIVAVVGVIAILGLAVPTASAARPPRPAPTTTTTAPTTTTTVASACGATIAKASGGTWECTFADEFSGTSLNRAKWVPQQTAGSGFTSASGECFVDSTRNVSVANGVLSLTARRESTPFTCSSPYGSFTTRYTSGMVSTWGRFTQTYGRFEIRAKFPSTSVPGLQEALWLWPADAAKYGAWPASGEIDIAEVYSEHADRAIPYIHYLSDGVDPNVTNTGCMIADVGAFHTYVAEWTSTSIKIIYDGTTCLVDTWAPAAPLVAPQPFDHPFLVALTQALGYGSNAVTAATPLPATTQVDYVHVWR